MKIRMIIIAVGVCMSVGGPGAIAYSESATASGAYYKTCDPPKGYSRVDVGGVSCSKARRILRSYKSGRDKSPFGYKCDNFTGEAGSGTYCKRGRRTVTGSFANRGAAKTCDAPKGFRLVDVERVSCSKARRILRSYKSGRDKSPFGYKCDGFTGEEGSGVFCKRGRREVEGRV